MNITMRNADEALCNLASKHKNLVLLHADFSWEQGIASFVHQFAERTFNFGLAEQAMVSAAAGFSITGKLPFVVGPSTFLAGRGFEQIRNTVCEQNLNIKFLAFADEFTEDADAMRLFENMKVFDPKTDEEVAGIIEKVILEYGPAYIRVPL